MSEKFTHLRVRSHFTMQDGLCKPTTLVEHAKSIGTEALALTDLGALHGIFEFYTACKKNNIKPLIGCEVFVARDTRFRKDPMDDRHRYRLILFAKSWEGYLSLCRLTSNAFLEGFYYKPRTDWETLALYSKDIVCLTGGMQGELIQRAFWDNDLNTAEKTLKKLKKIYGNENVFAEVQYHKFTEGQHEANDLIRKIAKKTNTPIVATGDVRYTTLDQREAHDVMLAIQAQTLVHDPNRFSMRNEDCSLTTAEDFTKIYLKNTNIDKKEAHEELENTQKIVNLCDCQFPNFKPILPTFTAKDGTPPREKFLAEVFIGLKNRYNLDIPPEKWKKLIKKDPKEWQTMTNELLN